MNAQDICVLFLWSGWRSFAHALCCGAISLSGERCNALDTSLVADCRRYLNIHGLFCIWESIVHQHESKRTVPKESWRKAFLGHSTDRISLRERDPENNTAFVLHFIFTILQLGHHRTCWVSDSSRKSAHSSTSHYGSMSGFMCRPQTTSRRVHRVTLEKVFL